jgi:hypothetical protein
MHCRLRINYYETNYALPHLLASSVTINATTTVAQCIVLRVPPWPCAGYLPFLLSATAGTTVIGAFDPLDQLADVCKKYDLWLHVDVSLLGTVVVVKKSNRSTFPPLILLTIIS